MKACLTIHMIVLVYHSSHLKSLYDCCGKKLCHCLHGKSLRNCCREFLYQCSHGVRIVRLLW